MILMINSTVIVWLNVSDHCWLVRKYEIDVGNVVDDDLRTHESQVNIASIIGNLITQEMVPDQSFKHNNFLDIIADQIVMNLDHATGLDNLR